MTKGRKVLTVDYTIEFEDVSGKKWRRAVVNRRTLEEIQAHEAELQKEYEALGEDTKKFQLFEVRLAAIKDFCGDQNGAAIDLDEIDMSDGQRLYSGFWRSVWG